MPSIGVNVAIFQGDRVLLVQREDFEVWCLPGGQVEPGESLAQAARREAQEETGVEVALTRLVGVYSRPAGTFGGGHVALFVGRPVGGALKPQLGEVIDLDYFPLSALPGDMIPWHRQRLLEAANGVGGAQAWVQDYAWPFEAGLDLRAVYARRDASGLSRPEFYQRFINQDGPAGYRCEVPGSGDEPLPVPLADAVSTDGVLKPAVGVNVAILQGDKILLTCREDYEVWCLPGGGVDEGETIAEAAVRETREEVGLDVRLTRLVGIYSEPGWFQRGLHIVLFAGQPVGGELRPQPDEVIELGYFSRSALPEPFLYGHRQRAWDGLAGVGGGVVWSQAPVWPVEAGATRQALYARRDASGLARRDFYMQTILRAALEPGRLEVGP